MDKTTPNQSLVYGVIGLLLGIVLTVVLVNNQVYGAMRMIGMGNASNVMQRGMMSAPDTADMMDMSMTEMSDGLKDKTGDDFDKAFISGMIAHHEGAIAMANEAKRSAKHDEIKILADGIIAAQTKEINEMIEWHKSWYGSEPTVSTPETSH